MGSRTAACETSDELKTLEIHFFFDSSFPVGYFSHSFGFESKVVNPVQSNEDTWREWIRDYLVYSIWYCDLEAIEKTVALYISGAPDSRATIEAIDSTIHLSRSTTDSRRASLLISQATKRSATAFLNVDSSILESFHVREPSTIVGLIAAMRKWDLRLVRLLYANSHALAMSQVLLRYAKIGQSQQLKLIAGLLPEIEKISGLRPQARETISTMTCYPLEIDQMNHQTLAPRMFQS